MKNSEKKKWKQYFKNKFEAQLNENMTPEKLTALYGFKLIYRGGFHGHIVLKFDGDYELRLLTDHQVFMCCDEENMKSMFDMARAYIIEFKVYDRDDFWKIDYRFNIDWGSESSNDTRKSIPSSDQTRMEEIIDGWLLK